MPTSKLLVFGIRLESAAALGPEQRVERLMEMLDQRKQQQQIQQQHPPVPSLVPQQQQMQPPGLIQQQQQQQQLMAPLQQQQQQQQQQQVQLCAKNRCNFIYRTMGYYKSKVQFPTIVFNNNFLGF
jgi:hypothetical protein